MIKNTLKELINIKDKNLAKNKAKKISTDKKKKKARDI